MMVDDDCWLISQTLGDSWENFNNKLLLTLEYIYGLLMKCEKMNYHFFKVSVPSLIFHVKTQ